MNRTKGSDDVELPREVTLREVGTRDGIQILGVQIPTEEKIELIERLVDAGVRRIEATSFVHPTYVPQMADAEAVMRSVKRQPHVSYEALVPNARGAERALSVGVDRLVLVVAASETFNQKNVRMSLADSFSSFEEVARLAHEAHVPIKGGLATSFGCPYEGYVSEARLHQVIQQFVDLGADEVGLADTTGMANPRQVTTMIPPIRERWPTLHLGLHFHNTRGMGLANVLAGLQAGVTMYDASIGGMGGCPFAPRATGNVCTEDMVHMLDEMGISSGASVTKLIECAKFTAELVGAELPGQVMKAGPRRSS
ncbi:MAG: hydroxymethylglutaryl-CoA lyase [Chloroflexota bacterium]